MKTYTHTITTLEAACGVTLEQVAELMPLILIAKDRKVILPVGTGPALSHSVARCALGEVRASFLGMSALGNPVYGPESA